MHLPSPFPDDVAFVQAAPGGAPGFSLLPAEAALLSGQAAARRVGEFTLGRGCARAALAMLEPAWGAQPILRNEGRQPRWPQGAVGAITHHKGHAAAAVARDTRYAGLGLDLEASRPLSEAMRVRLLRPQELATLAELPAEEGALRAITVFSAKESIFKCLHPATHVFLGFQDAEVREVGAPDKDGRGSLRWRLCRDGGPGFPSGYEGRGAWVRGGPLILTGVWVEA